MIKKIIVLILLLSLTGCSTITNAIPSTTSIEGKVLVNDKLNNEDFVVQVYKVDNNEAVVNSSLDPNGEFKLNIAEDGDYLMTAVNANGNDYKSNKISFSIKNKKLTSKVDFTLIISDERAELASSISIDTSDIIQGSVHYPNGINYVDIKVMLATKEGGKPIKVYMTDKIGDFKISEIQDGTYYICAQGPDNKASKWIKVSVLDSKMVGEEKIILELQ